MFGGMGVLASRWERKKGTGEGEKGGEREEGSPSRAACATFFCVGVCASDAPSCLRRLRMAGVGLSAKLPSAIVCAMTLSKAPRRNEPHCCSGPASSPPESSSRRLTVRVSLLQWAAHRRCSSSLNRFISSCACPCAPLSPCANARPRRSSSPHMANRSRKATEHLSPSPGPSSRPSVSTPLMSSSLPNMSLTHSWPAVGSSCPPPSASINILCAVSESILSLPPPHRTMHARHWLLGCRYRCGHDHGTR
mmetsp:Transcript_30250/g.87895  ORF Transcript_30250/g.87895 Transcript_30250/m.87895 type:complete len:250 (+) Transcript_30250:822-1571(+)